MPWMGYRRSVGVDKMSWVGWHNKKKLGLIDLYEKTQSHEQELYLATYFCTGCRCDEGLELTPEMFSWNKDAIVVEDVKVEKYYKYLRDDDNMKIPNPLYRATKKDRNKFLTEPIETFRNIDISRKKNKLADALVDFVERCDTKYLLPRHTQFTGEIDPYKHTSGANIWNKIHAIDPRIWPHWIRSQHVAFLIDVCLLNPTEVQDMMRWASIEMTSTYYKVSRVRRAKRMGIKALPETDERTS